MESANKRSDQAETGESGQGKSRDDLTLLIRRLGDMREEMLRFAEKCPGALSEADPLYEKSAENLIHYLALRRHDLRTLQSELAELGLSSLGRSESHVMATMELFCRRCHASPILPPSLQEM